MKIELTASILLDMLEEYSVIDKSQKELILSRRDYYESMFQNNFRRDPFVTELVAFACEGEKIKCDEEKLLKLIAARSGCEYIVIDPLKIDSHLDHPGGNRPDRET